MSTTCEVPFEPLALDGSNYSSWRSNVLIALKVLGPTAEGIMVASILPEDGLESLQRNWRISDSMSLLLTFSVVVYVEN
jgi:hypothetical protein